jgi:hypothetical protein
MHAPVPSVAPHTCPLQTQTRPPAHVQARAEPHPVSTGCLVSLHSAVSPPLPVHAGAGVQQVLTLHCVPVVHLLQVFVVPVGRHESWIGAHVPEARVHVSVRVQHDPTTPLAGAAPAAPVLLATHSWLVPQATLIVPPQPSTRLVPHWF